MKRYREPQGTNGNQNVSAAPVYEWPRGQILSIYRSRIQYPDPETGGLMPARTTWAMVEFPDGEIADVVLEQYLDLPTSWPVDPDMHGQSGDYLAFVRAQQMGKHPLTDYWRSRSENAPMTDPRQVSSRFAAMRKIRAQQCKAA